MSIYCAGKHASLVRDSYFCHHSAGLLWFCQNSGFQQVAVHQHSKLAQRCFKVVPADTDAGTALIYVSQSICRITPSQNKIVSLHECNERRSIPQLTL